jgi:threonyl-tRNA synthetase
MKNSSDHFCIVNQSAALVLAAAVIELFPGAQFLSGEGTSKYFFYDFTFPFTFQPELLILIEERMRLIIKEKRAVKMLEMMPLNAADLMRHNGQLLAAELLSNVEKATLSLCQIGNCVIPSLDVDLNELSIPFFKLFEGVVQENEVVRIVGSAGDKAVVKDLFKQIPYSSKSHSLIALKSELLAPMQEGSWIWRPRGEQIRRILIRWWEGECKNQNIPLVSLPVVEDERVLIQTHLDYFLRFGSSRVAQIAQIRNENSSEGKEGFFTPDVCFADRTYLFCSDQDFLKECISSLHFILQIPKILGFEFEVVLSVSMEASKNLRSQSISLWEKAFEEMGIRVSRKQEIGTPFITCVEIRLFDALGRKWTAPFIGIPLEPMPVGKGRMLVRSSFGSFERILALALEKTGIEQSLPLDAFCVKLNRDLFNME